MVIPDISLEVSLWQKGYLHVAGVDEAGKGPLAGPVTAGAVMIHHAEQIVATVRDSKLMSARQRENAYDQIITLSSSYGIGIVDAEEIDRIGIDFAVKKAMQMALEGLEKRFGKSLEYVIVDGSKTKVLDGYRSERILKGGLYHYSIAAGSILAKVTRDRIMHKIATEYPEYGFEKHVGYGTADHIRLINQYGPCPIHRKSFAPVKDLVFS
jgi:ribonuclease HII